MYARARRHRPDRHQGGRIEHPQRPAAVLDPDRAVGAQQVDCGGIEVSRDGFDVARAADPTLLVGYRGGQRLGEAGTTHHGRRAAADRRMRRSHGVQVQMVVGESGKNGAASAIQALLARPPFEGSPHLRDGFAADPDVHRAPAAVRGARAVDRGITEQQAGHFRTVHRSCPHSSAGAHVPRA